MKTPIYKNIVKREGIYWKWTVWETFEGHTTIFNDGYAVRFKTAKKRGDDLVKQETDFWKAQFIGFNQQVNRGSY